MLERYGRVQGPDPASSAVACVGGVIANNSSGMAAGIPHNPCMTVRSVTFVLPSGVAVDPAAAGAEEAFAAGAPDLAVGLMAIKADIEADPGFVARIRRKYAIKNTNGYRLDAFLDGDSPVEIFRRLITRSQGPWLSSRRRCSIPSRSAVALPRAPADQQVIATIVMPQGPNGIRQGASRSRTAGVS